MRGIVGFSASAATLLLTSALRGAEPQVGQGALALSRMPLAFEANEGQFSGEERFVTRSGPFALVLTDRGVICRLDEAGTWERGRRPSPRTSSATVATLAFAGAAVRQPRGEGLLPSVANYLVGDDPARWRAGVRQYARVRYRGIYPGIDVVFHGSQQKLEYDMIVAPYANPADIRLSLSGAVLSLDESGNLVGRIGGRTLLQYRPVAWQERRGKRRHVAASYEIAAQGREVRIRVGTYDRSAPLVIDPVLEYGVFVGGSGVEGANFLAVDSAGNAYIAGSTTSADLGRGATITGGLKGTRDAFVAKLGPTGALLFTTYLGGSADDGATGVAVNSSGTIFVCGFTSSTDYPRAGATQFQYGGGAEDAFVSILGNTGANLIASTTYGASGDDAANALALDANSNVYVAGFTNSSSIPGLNTASLQSRNGGGYDAFIAKFSSSGSLLFATFYGGSGDDQVYAATTDSVGDAWVVGTSESPTLPAAANANRASGSAGFLFRLAASGSRWKASQFFGGSSDQVPLGISIDSAGLAWVAGATNSRDYPTASSALQKTLGGGYDVFVTAFAPGSSSTSSETSTPTLAIVYSTFVGGAGKDIAYSITAGRSQTVYVAGYTSSATFLPAGSPQPGTGESTFLIELSFVGESMFTTIPTALYLKAEDASNPVTVARRPVSTADEIFIAGYGDATLAFPSSNQGRSSFHGGATDAFVAKLANASLSLSLLTATIPPIIPTGVTTISFQVSNAGPSTAENVVVRLAVPAGLALQSCSARFRCSVANGIITVTYPSLAAAASDIITLQVKASGQLGSLALNASLTSATNNITPGNNFAIAMVNVGQGQPPFIIQPPDSFSFPDQAVGQTGQRSLSLTPVGAVTIQLSLAPQQGTPDGVFGFAPGAATRFTTSNLYPIPLTFAPAQAGPASALLTVAAPQAVPPYTTSVLLDGSGTAPVNVPTAFLPHVVVGGGFVMSFYVLNNSPRSSTFSMSFFSDQGSPVSLPFAGAGLTSTLSDTIGGNGAKYYEAGSFDGTYASGWGAITADPSITISAILRRKGGDGSYYEAAVPATAGYTRFQIPFDATTFAANQSQIVTGFAVANLDPSTPATVTCTALDSTGVLIPGAVSVPPLNGYGHWADYRFAKLNGLRGTLDCSSTTKVGGLALRFIGTNSMSSLPVAAGPPGAGGSTGGAGAPTAFLPHFAVGGGFVMGFYVLNNSVNAAPFSIRFYDDQGAAVSLPFASAGQMSTLADTVGGNGAKYYEAGAFDGTYASGWGAITAGSSITISAILRRRGSDGSYYEAAVPATLGSNEFQIPFDATTFAANQAPIFTGFAIANLDPSTRATVTCTALDSSGSLIPDAVSVPVLNGYGHWADFRFSKLSGLRGTLDCSSTTKAGALALRFIGTNSMSSLPVVPVR